MPDHHRHRLLIRANWRWRFVLFVALVIVTLSLEQLLQAWWMPTASAALAVQQLRASDHVAESLRRFEWARSALPIVVWGLIVVFGWAMFIPMPRRWVKRLRRSLA